MVAIDKRYLDVDFPSEGLSTLADCRPKEESYGELFGTFRDSTDVEEFPRSEWKDIIELRARKGISLRDYVRKIKNQRNEGSCTSNATTQAWEIVTNFLLGKDRWRELSAISLYKRCGRSPNSGSVISTNIREMQQVGALLTNSSTNKDFLSEHGLPPAHVMPETGFYSRFPSGWKDTAKFFTLDEVLEIDSFAEFLAALWYGFPVVYGRRGHAICGVDAYYQSGSFGVIYANSWSPDWGDKGFGFDSERAISGAIRRYGAYAICNSYIAEALAA